MPTKEQHVTKADGCAELALSFPLDSQSRIDWALVILFYASLHYVEAYLAKSNVHLRSHIARDNAVSRDASLRRIFREYSDLKFYGYNARYEVSRFRASDVTDFAVRHFATIKAHLAPLL
jgi:hypothetical protein